MKTNSKSYFRTCTTLSVMTACFCIGSTAKAQTLPNEPTDNARPAQDIDRQEMVRFDQFLDSHREIAERLRNDPSLVDDREFIHDHPDLQTYLQDHPRVREQIKADPNAFMRREERFDRRDDDRDRDHDINRGELARFNQFLDSHRETAEQLRKDPSLVDNPKFVSGHPELQTYLQDHPRIREQLKNNPNAFMQADDRFDRRQDERDPQELARFNQFLDSHRETAEQLRKDPSLVDNQQFLQSHPELQAYLHDHPGIRQRIKGDPSAFMQADERFDRRQDERDPQELARFNQFLDSHRETAEQLRKDPSLVDNQQFLQSHPELQAYLHDHPGIRQRIKDDPNAFMQADARFDRRQDDRDRQELAHFDQFLDNHRETAEQLRRDPALVDNPQFVKGHPELQAYLQDHPGIREELEQNPNLLRQQASRFDHRDDGTDRDAMHRQFGEFLDGHSAIAQQLSSDPSLAKNQEFLANHPELRDYLNAHPDARQQLMDNPQSFVSSAQRFSNNANPGQPNGQPPVPSVKTPTVNPTANPKPNQ
jgi:hypothetical protein